MTPRTLQHIITLVLLLVFTGIVGGYIYFGMYQAKTVSNNINIDEVITKESDPEVLDSPISKEEKVIILEKLNSTEDFGTSSLSMEEQQAVLDQLTSVTEPGTLTENERRTLLDATNNSILVPIE